MPKFGGKGAEMRYIEDMRDGEMVSGVYLCKMQQLQKTKQGKSYISLVLQDKSGTLDSKIWDMGPGIGHFEAMDYVKVDGQISLFNGSNQLKVTRIRKADEGEYDPSDYMPTSEKDVKVMYKELLGYVDSVKEPHLKALLDLFFRDKEYSKQFANHSAAKSVHHGFVGGLLEHTLGVTKLCDTIAANYPIINRDLLLTAAMFHDVGKLRELSNFPENDYTDDGNLLGHIFMGAELVGKLAEKVEHFPPKLLSELKHCILAHHRKLEFGSPKVPALVEAMALSMADDLDAKMEQFRELFKANANADNGADGWLGYQKLLESNVRPTSKEGK